MGNPENIRKISSISTPEGEQYNLTPSAQRKIQWALEVVPAVLTVLVETREGGPSRASITRVKELQQRFTNRAGGDAVTDARTYLSGALEIASASLDLPYKNPEAEDYAAVYNTILQNVKKQEARQARSAWN